MELKFFDAHTHVQFPAYDNDREAVVKRALESGVGMVNVGSELESSRKAIVLAEKYDGLWACIGRHPVHATSDNYHDENELAHRSAEDSQSFDYDTYRELAKNPKVVAIGECGLDYFRLQGDEAEAKKKQRELFLAQIELAEEVKKPIMIHCRKAFPETIEILKANREKLVVDRPGIAHFFTGSKAQARELVELGFYFTFGGVITFARDYDKTIELIPIDRLLSETDAPYVSPDPHRGRRNEPAYVIEVVKKLAELKKVFVDEMAGRIIGNAERVFSIKII
jgi:TatD DNase family protein